MLAHSKRIVPFRVSPSPSCPRVALRTDPVRDGAPIRADRQQGAETVPDVNGRVTTAEVAALFSEILFIKQWVVRPWALPPVRRRVNAASGFVPMVMGRIVA